MPNFRSLRRALAFGALFLSTGAAAASAAGTGDIVLYAGRASVVKGAWSVVNDGTAAGGARMVMGRGGRDRDRDGVCRQQRGNQEWPDRLHLLLEECRKPDGQVVAGLRHPGCKRGHALGPPTRPDTFVVK